MFELPQIDTIKNNLPQIKFQHISSIYVSWTQELHITIIPLIEIEKKVKSYREILNLKMRPFREEKFWLGKQNRIHDVINYASPEIWVPRPVICAQVY